jgi:hypothetical protein
MIFYTTQSLEKPQTLNQIATSTARGLNLQNNSPWSFAFRTDTAHYEILPFSFSSIPLNSGQAWSLEPESATTYLPQSGLTIQVSGSYSSNVVTNFSTNSSLPIYTVPISGNVTIGNTVTTNTTIRNNPTVNINASGNTVTIGNTVTTNTTITNKPTVNINASGNTVTIGNTVTTKTTITNNPTVNINASGNTVTIGNTVTTNTTITNNPTVNISASGNTVTIGNTVTTNTTITNNPTVNISTSGNTVTIGNTVTTNTSITNEPTINISSTGNQIEVAGQIQNSTLTVSQAYAMEYDFTFSASSSQTINQTFAPQNQLTNVLRGKLYLYSPNGYSYNVYITPQANVTSNILSTIPQDNSITVTGATSKSAAGTPGGNTSDFYWQEPQQCNGFQVQLTTSGGATVTENPILWLIFDGNATPLENSYLTAPAYSFLQADTPGGVSAAGSASGNHAFPVSLYTVDSTASPITNTQIGEDNPLFVQQVTSAGFPVNETNPLPIYPSDYAYGMAPFGGGPPPTSTTYATTDSGVHAIQGIFATFVNTATTRQFVNLVFQNNNDTSQTFTILVQVGVDGTTVLNWTFAHPWAPFGSGGNLNFGWNQPNSDAVYGAAYVQYSNGN